MLTKFKVMPIVLLICVSLGLFAGGKQEGSGVSEITLWTCWLDEGEKALYEEFNASHPNIKVTYELIPFKDYATKIIASANTKQLPDVLRLQPKAPAQYGTIGYLLPLNDIATDLGGTNAYPQEYLNYNTVDGNLYGIPFYSLPHLLFYRKDLVQQNNLPLPSNWDNFQLVAKSLTSKDMVGYYGFLADASVGHMVHQWMGANNADTFGPNLEITIDSAETKETLDFLYKLYQNGYMNNDIGAVDMNDARLMFQTGKAAMITTSSSFLPIVAQGDLSSKVGILPIPKNNGDNNYAAFHSYSITREAKDLEAAKTFIKWINEPKNQVIYWDKGSRLGDIPINQILVKEGLYFGIEKVAAIKDFLGPAITASANGWTPGMAFETNEYSGLFDTQNIYQDMVLKMILEDMTSTEATAWAKDKMTEIMKK